MACAPGMIEAVDPARAVAVLRLMLEWGADEALADTPGDRFVGPGAAERAVTTAPGPAAAAPPPAAILAAPPAAILAAPPAAILAAPPAATPAATQAGAATPSQQAERAAAAAHSIGALREALAGFTGCGLRATAGSLVFADGNPDAGLVLIGEAPGAEEDRAGRPFVGASGRLLDQMLGSIGLDRTQCLITNIIPWRPPGNRNPTDNEILVCLPFLYRHLALLRPRRVVLLGGIAAQTLTGSREGIRKLRGRWMPITIPGLAAPVPALPILHPAYLLRQPGAKREAWADLIALKRALDAQI